MKIIIPIAGRGSRFKNEADRNPLYAMPKPFIPVKGYPMVRWATGSLPFVAHGGQSPEGKAVTGADIIFVALQEHEDSHQISTTIAEHYGSEAKIVFIPEVTRGAAETVYQAREYMADDEPVLVSDSDHFFDGAALWKTIQEHPEADGVIPVQHAPDKNPKWSFSREAEDGYVDLVAEKVPVSEWANIGAYYFRRGADLKAAIEEVLANDERTNNEFYVAPLYNKLIAKGGKVVLSRPEYVHGLGIPSDLEYFVEQTDYTL